MAVTVTKLQAKGLYLLTVAAMAGQLELFRWTKATGAITAGAQVPLDADFVAWLNKRFGTLINAVAGADQEAQDDLLNHLLAVRDGRGDLALVVNAGNPGIHALEIGPCLANVTYYVFLGMECSQGAQLW